MIGETSHASPRALEFISAIVRGAEVMPHILIDRKEREAGDRLTGFRDKRTAGRWVPEGHVSAPIGRVPLAAVMFPFFVQGVCHRKSARQDRIRALQQQVWKWQHLLGW